MGRPKKPAAQQITKWCPTVTEILPHAFQLWKSGYELEIRTQGGGKYGDVKYAVFRIRD